MALAIEQYGRVYREAYGVPVVNLRIFRCFGPDEDADRPDAGIVARFIAPRSTASRRSSSATASRRATSSTSTTSSPPSWPRSR